MAFILQLIDTTQKNKTKNLRGFYETNFVDFQNFMTIEFCWRQNFDI